MFTFYTCFVKQKECIVITKTFKKFDCSSFLETTNTLSTYTFIQQIFSQNNFNYKLTFFDFLRELASNVDSNTVLILILEDTKKFSQPEKTIIDFIKKQTKFVYTYKKSNIKKDFNWIWSNF